MKKHIPITISRKQFNKKIYSNDTALALVYMYEGTQRTSFLMKNGFICDDWPFRTNMLPKESMENRDSIKEAVEVIAMQNKIHINIVELI